MPCSFLLNCTQTEWCFTFVWGNVGMLCCNNCTLSAFNLSITASSCTIQLQISIVCLVNCSFLVAAVHTVTEQDTGDFPSQHLVIYWNSFSLLYDETNSKTLFWRKMFSSHGCMCPWHVFCSQFGSCYFLRRALLRYRLPLPLQHVRFACRVRVCEATNMAVPLSSGRVESHTGSVLDSLVCQSWWAGSFCNKGFKNRRPLKISCWSSALFD